MTKTTKPKIRIHNVETNEIVDREMTDLEIAQYEADIVAEQTRKSDADAKEAQKKAILDRIGLTADEAKLILG